MRLGDGIDRGRKGLWRWTPTISVGAGAAAGEESRPPEATVRDVVAVLLRSRFVRQRGRN